MRVGELIVARLKAGPTVVRCQAPPASASGGRAGVEVVRVSVGRNREARLPADRVILATGVVASGEEVEELRRRWEALAADVDLAEVWEVARDDGQEMGLEDLAELYWGSSYDVAQKVALLLYLERGPLYFVADRGAYTARSLEEVQEIQARRRREVENAEAASSLMEGLSQGALPPDPTRQQSTLLEHLRLYAIHGEDYTRSAVARDLLGKVPGSTRELQRLCFDLLVESGVFAPDEPLELERAGIAEEFSLDALDEAAAVDVVAVLGQPGRRDLTSLSAVTIDDAGTEDRDDAVSVEVEESGEGVERVYRVGVHIADAGALVPVDSALDREADRRMATLYLPERKVSMLPPEVSSGKGSLAPGERRAALSLLARVTESGEVLDWEVVPSVVRSAGSLSYEEGEGAIEDSGHSWHGVLAPLYRISQSLQRKREVAGAVVLDRPEMSIRPVPSGDVEVRVVSRSSPARLMVTEMMVLCNSLLAEFCRREDIPAAYRSQPAPDFGDVVEETVEGPLRWYLLMRRLLPADLDISPRPHGGLGVSAYIQATSPLRRYPDLVMQRQISHYLATDRPLYSRDEISSVAQRAEEQLRELGRLEEVRRRYWFLKFLRQRLARGEDGDGPTPFEAVVLENQPRRPALLELADYPFRVRTDLPPSSAPGDTVTLRLHGVDLWSRVGHFVHERSAQ